MVIFKVELVIDSTQSIIVPQGAKPLSVQKQNGKLMLWFACSPSAECVQQKEVNIVGTGHSFPDDWLGNYVGTVQQQSDLVLHVFVH